MLRRALLGFVISIWGQTFQGKTNLCTLIHVSNKCIIWYQQGKTKPNQVYVSHIILQYFHYDDVIMTMLASQITSLTVVYSIVYTGVNQRKHQSSASLAFVWEIHREPVNFPHKWSATRKMLPFDDVIMSLLMMPKQRVKHGIDRSKLTCTISISTHRSQGKHNLKMILQLVSYKKLA